MKDQIGTSYEVYVISNNKEFKELIEEIEEVTLAVTMPNLEADIDCKAIFVDGEALPVSMLKDLRDLYPLVPVLYQSSNIQNSTMLQHTLRTCSAHQVQHVKEELTKVQAVEDFNLYLFKKDSLNKKRVVSFFGTHSGAGVSTTLMNVADLLAKRVETKVLVLSLNPWDPADYFLQYSGRYLNDLKIDLAHKNLTDERLLNSLHHYKDSFYHLAGNRDVKQQRYYSSNEIDYLISRARDLFDVVLIDGGPHFDNACYAQAFRESDLRILITTQEPKGFQGYFPNIFEQLIVPLGGRAEDYFLVINRFSPQVALATEKDISERLGMPHLTTIPDEGVLGDSAITQKTLLHENVSDKEYVATLLPIVRAIIAEYNLKQIVEEPTQHKGLFSFKKRKSAVR